VLFRSDRLIGIALHISCMIDRLIVGGPMVGYPDREDYISKNRRLFTTVKDTLENINTKYKVDISQDEICYIMDFFNPDNIGN
jgi:transcriptional regulatory protein LevR